MPTANYLPLKQKYHRVEVLIVKLEWIQDYGGLCLVKYLSQTWLINWNARLEKTPGSISPGSRHT